MQCLIVDLLREKHMNKYNQIKNLSPETVLALLQDDSTSDELFAALAQHHFVHDAPLPLPAETIHDLAHQRGKSTKEIHTALESSNKSFPWIGEINDLTMLSPSQLEHIQEALDESFGIQLKPLLFQWFNKQAKKRRLRIFNRRNDDQIILLAEGDSWFQYPVLKRDIIDHLIRPQRNYAIRCMSTAGDMLRTMKENIPKILNEIASINAKAFLLSGGGNDIFGDPNVASLFRDYEEGRTISDCLRGRPSERIADLRALYQEFIDRIGDRHPDLPILCHGYGNPHLSNRGKWISEPMQSKGFTDIDFLQRLMREYLGRFNSMLEALAQEHDNVHYIDCRELTQDKALWSDELHLRSPGVSIVAEEFDRVLAGLL